MLGLKFLELFCAFLSLLPVSIMGKLPVAILFATVDCIDTPTFLGSTIRIDSDVIDQTRGRVFPPISKHREVGWKNEAQPSFFNQLRGVWK